MKQFSTSLIASALCLTASAQIHLTADLQNNHLWRGMEVADGCVVLTDLGYTFAKGHVTLGLWGGTNTQDIQGAKPLRHISGRRLRVLRNGHIQLLARCHIQQPTVL